MKLNRSIESKKPIWKRMQKVRRIRCVKKWLIKSLRLKKPCQLPSKNKLKTMCKNHRRHWKKPLHSFTIRLRAYSETLLTWKMVLDSRLSKATRRDKSLYNLCLPSSATSWSNLIFRSQTLRLSALYRKSGRRAPNDSSHQQHWLCTTKRPKLIPKLGCSRDSVLLRNREKKMLIS